MTASAGGSHAIETVQAAVRGWVVRAEDRRCRREFEAMLAEVEGAAAVPWVTWGRGVSRPRIAAPSDSLDDPTIHSLSEELGRLKAALALKRGQRASREL